MFLLNVISIMLLISIFIAVDIFFKSLDLYKSKDISRKVLCIILFILSILAIIIPSRYAILAIIIILILFSIINCKSITAAIITIVSIAITFYLSVHILIVLELEIFKIDIYMYNEYNIQNIIFICISISIFICEIAIIKYFISKTNLKEYIKKYEKGKDRKFIYLLILNVIFAIIIIYINLILSKKIKIDIKVLSAIFSVYIIYILSIVVMSYIYGKKIKIDLLIKKKNDELENLHVHSKELQELSDTIRSYKHDTINILNSIKIALHNDECGELEKYLDEYLSPLTKSIYKFEIRNDVFENVDPIVLRTLLNSKIQIAESKDINIVAEISDRTGEFKIGQVDLNRIVGIFLDNAIEAVENVKDRSKREIRIAIISEKNVKSIVIMNYVEDEIPPIYKMKEKGFSTKFGSKRGMGLSTVSKITNKYDNVAFNIEIFEKNVIVSLDIKEV